MGNNPTYYTQWLQSASMASDASGVLFFARSLSKGLLEKGYKVAAVNDIVPADNLAYLLKYDSTQGAFKGEVQSEKSVGQGRGR